MEKKTKATIIIVAILVTIIATGLYLRWRPTGFGSNSIVRWGRGYLATSERAYYSSRMGRIIKNWQQTMRHAEINSDGQLKESYQVLLVIDLDKPAIWIEENGRIQEHNYTELPAGIKWEHCHTTPKTNKKLTGRTVLKIRGLYSSQQTSERFSFIASGREGSISLDFNSTSLVQSHGKSSRRMRAHNFKSSTKKEDELYGSLIVTDAEYQQYRQSFSKAALSPSEEKGRQIQKNVTLKENKATWQKNEKFLYLEIERQVRKKGYTLRSLKVEPGPDFSAGHAEIRGHNKAFLRSFWGRVSSVKTYLNIDYLGDNIWYAKSVAHPLHPIMPRQVLKLEFLICSEGNLSDSREKEFLTKGWQKQQQFTPVPETPWKAILSNGTTVEFIGICENPSAGKQWWGPDGSPLDYVPYINVTPYDRAREDRKVFEFAWRIQKLGDGGAIRYSMEGSTGSYGKQIHDRYGNRIIEGLSAEGHGFDASRQKTSFRLGFTDKDWKTALTIKDTAGETTFLGKQRILLDPPTIENGQVVIRCYEESGAHVNDYQTDFGLIYREDSAIKTVSLDRYEEGTTVNRDTGLREHTFIIDNLNIHQIEGVCFRYRPFEFVKFKNISLVPGKNQGFEIELGKQ